MVLGSDGAWYADLASAAAGAKASAAGLFPSTPDDQSAIFGNYGGSTMGSGAPGQSLDLGTTFSDSTGTPKVLDSAGNWLTQIEGQIDKSVPILGKLDSFFGVNPNSPGGGVMGALSGASKALDFITDIPRVVTTLLGLILIIAGIFALSKGPAVNIVTGAVKDAVTS